MAVRKVQSVGTENPLQLTVHVRSSATVRLRDRDGMIVLSLPRAILHTVKFLAVSSSSTNNHSALGKLIDFFNDSSVSEDLQKNF